MNSDIFKDRRKSFLEYNETYFWTCTIKDWKYLLETADYKQIVLNSLRKLVEQSFLEVYGFVIMPNHIHLILKILKPNGKEKPSSSFLKDTSHELRKDLIINNPNTLRFFEVTESDRKYRIWQRDPLAINMFNINILEQKLNYIHYNPLQERWHLVQNTEDYYWSSARFYKTGIDDFNILTDYRDVF
jgi:putative transposase